MFPPLEPGLVVEHAVLTPQKIIGILEVYGYATGRTGKWVGILIGITVGYRILGLIALRFR